MYSFNKCVRLQNGALNLNVEKEERKMERKKERKNIENECNKEKIRYNNEKEERKKRNNEI